MCDEPTARRLRPAPMEPRDSDEAWLRRIARGNDASRRGPRRGPVAQARGGERRGSSCGRSCHPELYRSGRRRWRSECRSRTHLASHRPGRLHWELKVAKRGPGQRDSRQVGPGKQSPRLLARTEAKTPARARSGVTLGKACPLPKLLDSPGGQPLPSLVCDARPLQRILADSAEVAADLSERGYTCTRTG